MLLVKIITAWCVISVIFMLGWMVFQNSINPRNND
jgi:hypothetical protein